jgi:hypothetical protein
VKQRLGLGEKLLIRVRAVEETAGWQHAVMQDPTDKNALAINPIKDDMFLVLDPPVSGQDAITGATDLRQGGKPREALLQFIQVRKSLLLAPGVERVIADLDEVKPGEG